MLSTELVAVIVITASDPADTWSVRSKPSPACPFCWSWLAFADPMTRTIYWHRDLPPLGAEAMGEHVVEAVSERVPGTLIHRDELWDRCYEDLMAQARARLQQEIRRLGGNFAHVLDESIGSRHDNVTNESWLHGQFTYVLYK